MSSSRPPEAREATRSPSPRASFPAEPAQPQIGEYFKTGAGSRHINVATGLERGGEFAIPYRPLFTVPGEAQPVPFLFLNYGSECEVAVDYLVRVPSPDAALRVYVQNRETRYGNGGIVRLYLNGRVAHALDLGPQPNPDWKEGMTPPHATVGHRHPCLNGAAREAGRAAAARHSRHRCQETTTPTTSGGHAPSSSPIQPSALRAAGERGGQERIGATPARPRLQTAGRAFCHAERSEASLSGKRVVSTRERSFASLRMTDPGFRMTVLAGCRLLARRSVMLSVAKHLCRLPGTCQAQGL